MTQAGSEPATFAALLRRPACPCQWRGVTLITRTAPGASGKCFNVAPSSQMTHDNWRRLMISRMPWGLLWDRAARTPDVFKTARKDATVDKGSGRGGCRRARLLQFQRRRAGRGGHGLVLRPA